MPTNREPTGGAFTVGWSVLSLLQVPVWFSGIAPPLSLVGTSGRDRQTSKPEVRFWTRRGEVIAGIASLVTGAIITYAADSPIPFWVAVGSVAVHVYLYEAALRGGIGLTYNPFS